MFLSRNKKNNVYPCKPQFYNVKVGFKGVCFRDVSAEWVIANAPFTNHVSFGTPSYIETGKQIVIFGKKKKKKKKKYAS